MSNSGTAEVLIPRSLCLIEDIDNLIIDVEDLCSVSISWEDGFVSELKPLKNKITKPKNILFPRFVETHSHFDKSFTWADFPNLESNYGGALSVNLEEHKTRTTDKVLERVEKSSKYKLEIDLHIDESIIEPGAGIKVLLETIENLKINSIPITCSHLSSLISLSNREILNLGEKMAEKNIKVIALPLTNFWLLNRSNKTTSLKRPVAPIKQLQKSHVDVSLGSDNVQDPWYPFGNFDPFYMLSCSIPMLQLNPWERMTLSSIFLAPSRLLNLKWDGLIKKGCPADFVILDAQRWADVFSSNLKRKVFINGDLYC